MPKTIAALLLVLMTCACAGREEPPRLVADPSLVPDFPPPPVDPKGPQGEEMLPYLNCLSQKGWQSCRGAGSSSSAKATTAGAQKP